MDNVKVSIESIQGSYRDIADRCRTTVNMDKGTKEVSSEYMRKLYRSEHSPIRLRSFIIRIESIPSWIATHLARHSVGVTPYISTQREDRTNTLDRDNKPQGALVNMELHANAQAIINISRKRLCRQAHPRTVSVWEKVLEEIRVVDEALYSVCVPECIYRGFCPELNSCRYVEIEIYNARRKLYTSNGIL